MCTLCGKNTQANPKVILSEESRFHLEWLVRSLEIVPTRPLHSSGNLSRWGPKSKDFAEWRLLAAENKFIVVETDASKLTGWSYHICQDGTVVSGIWDDIYLEESSWAENASYINFKELRVAWKCIRNEADRFKSK